LVFALADSVGAAGVAGAAGAVAAGRGATDEEPIERMLIVV
jgi:hypothetical protein